MLKDYQKCVVKDIEDFFGVLDEHRKTGVPDYVSHAFTSSPKYRQYPERPLTGAGKIYPRVCIKMPTGGGKTLVAVETIRAYQNLLAKKKTGLVVWIAHRESIYRQTIENLQTKSHPYRQFLDQASGNRTLILEKGQTLRRQDVEENLVVLMLMIQSATRDTNKMFEDSGYTDFFPPENRYDLHAEMLKVIPNLDTTSDTLFDQMQIKTSLGNTIRTLEPLIIVDEFHTMFTDNARATLDGLNPSVIVGLSATPKRGMNIVSSITGRDLKAEDMIKLDLHIIPPSHDGDWRAMLAGIKAKREELEKKAHKLELNEGVYIRPIALIQVERTGRDQRGHGFVHSEDVRELLIASGVAAHQIAVKSSTLDEIKAQKLVSKESEVRYIITKEALKEGWDCSFAYILGVIPNARNGSSMTQLVGRILRQPYAKKTGVPELDESYVFFASGHVQEVLDHVKNGFEDEGLGDVAAGIEVRDASGQVVKAPRAVRIKKKILQKYPESLYLPVWLVKNGKQTRRFSYDADIKPSIDWDAAEIETWLKGLLPTIGKSKKTQLEMIVGLEGQKQARETTVNESVRFDTLYLTRRLSETVENAFVAYDIAKQVFAILTKKTEQDVLDSDAGYIARELEKHLRAHQKTQEESAFAALLKNGKMELAVSDDPAIGYTMPDTDMIESSLGSSYSLTLYEDVDPSSLNTLESGVARYIEQSHNVLWWTRNKVGHGWYAIQGWQRGKIRPDFIIARKNERNELEFVYVVESKGEQLMGNADTEYKDAVFNRINGMKGKIAQVRTRLTTMKLNDRFDFELIPQGEEERRLRAKL
ncbi:MAG: DEAD/DEAH box helicase family protein [bacterium]|nr:DEAD/DEAH box helicase family protein [bacterium]